jgi:hypothetical protein
VVFRISDDANHDFTLKWPDAESGYSTLRNRSALAGHLGLGKGKPV